MDNLKKLAKQIAANQQRHEQLTQQRNQEMLRLLQSGHPKVSVARAGGISRQALDKILKGQP